MRVLITIGALLIADGASGQNDVSDYLHQLIDAAIDGGAIEDTYENFALWNLCRSVELRVDEEFHNENEHAKKISLTAERIRSIAESRLRYARIYADYDPDSDLPYLDVSVNVFREAFAIDVSFKRFLFNELTSTSWTAATWTDGSVGIHANDGSFILQSVGEIIELFTNEYLRVNESACS